MKVSKRHYWKGIWYDVGDEAAKDAPSHVTEGKKQEPVKEKVVRKVSTKSKAPKTENKNAAPKKTEDKSQK